MELNHFFIFAIFILLLNTDSAVQCLSKDIALLTIVNGLKWLSFSFYIFVLILASTTHKTQ